MMDEIFDPEADQRKFKMWTSFPPPRKTYSILFTPRSGSSWLTSILTKTKSLGTPEEWFNPTLMPSSSRAKGARNLDQFIQAISRHESHGNIFGFEATYHQIEYVFENDANFMASFKGAIFFWLIREDIISQGVSLDKMVQTRITHTASSSPQDVKRSDGSYSYDAPRILKWIQHIRAAEVGTERMISKFAISPTRLSYEGIMASGEQKVLNVFAAKLGLNISLEKTTTSTHSKIGTGKNIAFAERFRLEHPNFVDDMEVERSEMISRLEY